MTCRTDSRRLTKADRLTHTADVTGDKRHVTLVSAQTRSGLRTLASRVRDVLEQRYGEIPVSRPALTRARHRIAIEHAGQELAEFQKHWAANDLPASIAAVHIRAAVGSLDELIGAVDVDDVL